MQMTHRRYWVFFLLFLFSGIAYLDRVNMSVAGKPIEHEFGLSPIALAADRIRRWDGESKRGLCGPRASRKNQCRWVGGSLVTVSACSERLGRSDQPAPISEAAERRFQSLRQQF